MVDVIYVESHMREHPRVKRASLRYPGAKTIYIERYAEVFNPASQNFCLQKQNPALILAEKTGRLVLKAPVEYSIGGQHNYYFSHMLNCVYDCRYCFLQGMFRSAHFLVFVNYEDFLTQMVETCARHGRDPVWFFSGYDCDSLAYEPVTRFTAYLIPRLAGIPNARLELRTKSTQIRHLLRMPPADNAVVAFSLSPDNIAGALELGAPPPAKRLEAARRLTSNGWKIGLRFDPLIWHRDYRDSYAALFDATFRHLEGQKIHDVTLGGFRLPRDYYKRMVKLYPREPLFNAGLTEIDDMVCYREEVQAEMLDYCETMIRRYVDDDKIFSYAA